jgi:hypothetical protein
MQLSFKVSRRAPGRSTAAARPAAVAGAPASRVAGVMAETGGIPVAAGTAGAREESRRAVVLRVTDLPGAYVTLCAESELAPGSSSTRICEVCPYTPWLIITVRACMCIGLGAGLELQKKWL